VTDTAEGTRRVYSIDQAGLAAVRVYFDRFWDKALDAFRLAAEANRRVGAVIVPTGSFSSALSTWCTGGESNPYASRRRNLKPGWHPRILGGSRKQAPRAIRVDPKSGVFTRAWGNRGAIRPRREPARDQVEAALARALDRASEAGRFDVVAQPLGNWKPGASLSSRMSCCWSRTPAGSGSPDPIVLGPERRGAAHSPRPR
jgi:hypothetical protein